MALPIMIYARIALYRIVLHCILYAPVVRLPAFRWPKVFHSILFFAILRTSRDFECLLCPMHAPSGSRPLAAKEG